jgi:uncharacterized protein (TIGR04255 family)
MLVQVKTLTNAPIVEALAQINYEIGHPVESAELDAFIKPFAGFAAEEISQIQIAPPADPKINRYGYRLSNQPKNESVQLTKDFFAYSSTSKYKDWSDFRGRVQSNLVKFLSVSNAININRLALRYNNRVLIPHDLANLNAFMKVYPNLGDFAENRPETINLQYTMPISSIDGRAIVTLRMDRNSDDKWLLVLDIDVFVAGKFKPSYEDLLAEFDKLRDVKNEVFGKTLTNAAIATFNT